MTTAVLVLARTLHIGGAMMLFSLPFFMLIILRPAFSVDTTESYTSFCQKMTKWLGVALWMEIVSGAIWFWFIAAQRCHQSPWSFLGMADLNAVLWQTQFGQLWLVRGGSGVALGVVLYFVSRRETLLPATFSLLNALVVMASGILLISLALAGPVVAGIHRQILHLLADTPHLLIGAIWPTGLIPMAYFLWHVTRDHRPLPSVREVATLQRFSKASLIAVIVLIVTGSINGWLIVGSWENLVTTAYGRLLLIKMSVVIVMIGIGAFNRFHLMRSISDLPIMFRALGKTIAAESCLALVVLFIVGMHT
jgi:copper resistance protein D